MDFNPLWFIKGDCVLLADPPDYSQLLGIIHNQSQFLQQCHEPGLQVNLYQILRIIDGFFTPQRIVEVVTIQHQQFSDEEINQIQTRTTEFRILIQCEKLYANKCWLNKKQDSVVEIRILACLLRIYLILERAWEFFIGKYPNIRTRMQKSKLILPLNKLQPFVNDVYMRLQKIEPYYYKYQNQRYILETHILFKAFKQLLFEFPTITHREVVKKFKLRRIILSENQLWKKNYVERILRAPSSPVKKVIIRPRRYTDMTQEARVKSLDHNKAWDKRFSVSIKVQKSSNSLVKIDQPQQQSYPSIRFPFQPIIINRRQKHFTQYSLQRTNSQCASTKNVSDSRSHLPSISKLSIIDEDTLRESMSPTRIPKTKHRRPYIDSLNLGPVKQQSIKPRQIQFDFQSMKEKEGLQYSLTKYHQSQISENRIDWKSQKLKLGKEQIQFTGSMLVKSQIQIQSQIQKLLSNKISLKPLKRNKYYRESMEQQ